MVCHFTCLGERFLTGISCRVDHTSLPLVKSQSAYKLIINSSLLWVLKWWVFCFVCFPAVHPPPCSVQFSIIPHLTTLPQGRKKWSQFTTTRCGWEAACCKRFPWDCLFVLLPLETALWAFRFNNSKSGIRPMWWPHPDQESWASLQNWLECCVLSVIAK